MSALRALQVRLRLWPAKVASPIADLVANGLMRLETAEAVLDAGDIAGEPQHVLGFAVALLEMERDRVPVIDTIRLAREIGAPLNLRWSAKRWQTEHDRLSRLATLRRLEAANEVYDLSGFEPHLPERWKGYLIRTSRRLGMEGMRQRHCVAGYHGMIRHGGTAIAVVFVNKTRWTVALHRFSGRAETSVGQIKGRDNRDPSVDVVRAVHQELGTDPMHAGLGACRPAARSYRENLQAMLPILREHGVDTLHVSFAGGGDEGQIEDVSCEPFEKWDAIRNATVPVTHVHFTHEDGDWQRIEETEQRSFVQAAVHLTEDYIEETGVDYSNNEGGFGELVVDVAEGSVGLEVSHNVQASELAFSRVMDIESGEVIETRV